MTTPATSTFAFRTALSAVCGVALVCGAFAQGCDDEPPITLTGGNGGSAGAGGGSGGTPGANAEALFAAIEDDLVQNCEACHKLGGVANTPFLQSPDYYESVRTWPGIVTKNPDDSIFVTYASGTTPHSGPELDALGILDAVKAWLTEESKGIIVEASDAGPQIEPFAPILGFNAVYLDALGADFKGMALTFQAKELTPNAIELSEIEFHPTAANGAHVVHPLFVVHPVGQDPDPDPVDSFSNADIQFAPGVSGALSPGTLVLTNWLPEARMSIAFQTIELYVPGMMGDGGGGTTGGGCKDVGAYAAVKNQFNVCGGCHGGANGQATSALDMTKLGSDDTFTCGQIRNRINPGDPSSSQIFVNSDPNGGAGHPFKFNGDGGDWQNFVDAVTPWIVAEQ